MNKKTIFSLSVIFIVAIVFCWLGWRIFNIFSALYSMPGFQENSSCVSYLPSEDLKAVDLVGTWAAGDPYQSDMLILRKDNKYKQIIHFENTNTNYQIPNIDYQTDWQEWRLERDSNGFVYLHLKGMRTCGLDPERSCENSDYSGFDFCQNKPVFMNGEGILLVMLYNKRVDSSKELTLFFPLGSENTWVYELQKP